MHLSNKTLEILRVLINEDTHYRSGSEIIKFFSEFDYCDTYKQGFPSRSTYTDLRLSQINGTHKIVNCIKALFNPVNFIEDLTQLDKHINTLNKYLQFEKFKVTRKNIDIQIEEISEIILEDTNTQASAITENFFLNHEFKIDIKKLNLISPLIDILENRMNEIEKAFKAEAFLSVVLLAGSTLEGILLNIASQHPKAFNSSEKSPKRDGKVKKFEEWSLNNFLEVAHSNNLIEKDTYRFSIELRNFRNYIHPFQQMSENFNPREQTAKICLQVLKSAISDIEQNINKI